MKKSQTKRVLEYMQEHNGITSYQAFRDLKITRLSARIYDLRRDGVNIDQERITKKNKDGELVGYDRYFVAADVESPTENEEEQSGYSKAERTHIPRSEQVVQAI